MLFTSAQIPGHLDWGGYLATAAELHRLGHQVLWVTGPEVQPLLAKFGVPGQVVQATGWRWPPPPPLAPAPNLTPAALQQMRMVRALDQWLDVDLVGAATAELLSVGHAFKPDLVVGEMFMSGAPIVAERLGVPFAVVGWPAQPQELPATAQPVVDMARQRLQQLFSHFGVTGLNWAQQGPPAVESPLLHITYWSRRWFRNVPSLGAQNQHMGGLTPVARPWRTPWLSQLPMDRPWIFVTLGTSFTDDPNFFVAASQAVVQVGGLPILAVGQGLSRQALQALEARLPSPRVVTTEVDFSEVLPYAAVAIHHGGAGTTHALVTHGVPQIVVPRAADQARQAEGVARTGVGVRLAVQQVGVANLVQLLQAMLPADAPVRAHARTLQAEFAALGGVPRAAQQLLSLC